MEPERYKPGVDFTKEGIAEIILWSPLAEKVEVIINDREKLLLQLGKSGIWKICTNALKPGDFYWFIINGKKRLADPSSLLQHQGVHGSSQAVDLKAFRWTDEKWENPELKKYIIYELHTGTFTQEGNFYSIEKKLDYLQELGITAIEIMPVAQFPGKHNWGYDGVFPFAVQNDYGGPKGLQQLVDACHRKGIAVILDVVYNHLGPEGNYLESFAPYFTDKYKTPWGGAINFDDQWSDGVRNYFIQNALMWLRDFHLDALRLDAVHAIKDFGPSHILKDLKVQVNNLMEQLGKKFYLIVESDLNDNKFINPLEKEGYGMDAQWIDEFHHALRITAGEEKQGYYEDFNEVDHLAKSYKDAYVYDGQWSGYRKKFFGKIASENPGSQFIVFSQNHDQVGNRMLGERTSTLVGFEMLKLLAAAVLLSPYLPMLFMGEEWGETHPFLYFADHSDPELVEGVRKGRKEEFAAFQAAGEAPDPFSQKSFQHSKLQWTLLKDSKHATLFRYYKKLILLRKTHPLIGQPDRFNLSVDLNKSQRTLSLKRWNTSHTILVLMNFSRSRQKIYHPHINLTCKKIWDSADKYWDGPGEALLERLTEGHILLGPESVVVLESSGC
ncbi:MAG: malto-oligosyltrehalose trehalohydrolase [Flavisolibacter sp.]